MGDLYTVRNYYPADYEKYIRLNIEIERVDPIRHDISPQILRESLYQPNHSPEQDLFVVETKEGIVGYLDIIPELQINRVTLDCFIHPTHRRRELAIRLFSHAESRVKELGVKTIHVNISQNNTTAKIVLRKLGFTFIRRFLQLRLDMNEFQQRDANQTTPKYRHLQPGEENELAQIQNQCFSGSWGYNPNTVEEIIYYTKSSSCSPEDILLACEGNKIASYCWTKVFNKGTTGERRGQIFMLGVCHSYRGKGLGRETLLAGLSYLKSKDLPVVELTVDSKNRTARSLYQSIGFKLWTSNLWYEKTIN